MYVLPMGLSWSSWIVEEMVEERMTDHYSSRVENSIANPSGPCYDKFDYDAQGISEDNQLIINQFKELFIGYHVYIYSYKGTLQYKISERYYPGYGEDFTGWDDLGDPEDWSYPKCAGTNHTCLEILSKIAEIRKKKQM